MPFSHTSHFSTSRSPFGLGLLGLLGFIFAMSPLSAAEEKQANHKGLDSVSLICDQERIVAGKPFLIGLHFIHKPGYHTYWKYSGTVGLPTDIQWKLPKGFVVSEFSWPHPERVFMTNIPCNGYKRDITLFAKVTPPKHLNQQNITFSANASWMCCGKECNPSSGSFALKLPVSKTLAPSHDPRFKTAIKESKFQTLSTCSLLIKADAAVIKVRIPLDKTNDEKLDQIEIFSKDGQISSDSKFSITRTSPKEILLTTTRAERSPTKRSTLPLIIKIQNSYYRTNPSYKP